MSFKSLLAYPKAFSLAMEIFQESKTFPKTEKFALTSQIIRSSGSVCFAIAVACEYISGTTNRITASE
ncbi:four helix bundle protein [Salinimicrobium flavum]|uniref:Four helix bundle protein n=1 Tax=Salinimicrobium flavum TaxID=1737065 RepID=A0ABW5IYG2_9FLAO